MTTFNVLLDTNIFINAKYDFDRASLHNLKKYCDDGIVIMFTNDIIIREVKHHIEAEVGLLAAQAKNAIKNHGELINAVTPPVFETIKATLLNAPQQLTAAFDSYMDGTIVLSNTGLSIIDLFNDYFVPNAPFEGRKGKKSEFPDAAVIMSIKQYLTLTENTFLHVVTDDDGWHNALKDIAGVVIYKELKSLLTRISKEQEDLYRRIVSFIGERMAFLQECAKDWLFDQDWDFAVDEVEMCIECDEVDEVDVIDVTLILDGIEYIDNRESYAVATLSGIAKIKISFSYIDHTEEIYDKEDHVWYNTVYGHGLAEIKAPISLSVTVMLPDEVNGELDLDPPDFNELDKGSLETIKYELTEQEDDLREPYFDICPDCGKKIGLHNDGGNGFCVDCAPNH
jgi:hypothetical protein